MKTRDTLHVKALEKYLDAHDDFLAQSKAVYREHLADTVEDLDFQRSLVQAALNAKRQWTAELATGIGKSIIAARIVLERLKLGSALYICASPTALGDLQQGIINKFHRVFAAFGGDGRMLGELNQLSRLNDVSFVTPHRLAALERKDPNLVQDLLRAASCVVVDEAHHFPSGASNDLKVYGRVHDLIDAHVRDGLVVAMTGTYDRLDGRIIMGKEVPDARLTVQDAIDLGRCPEVYAIQIIMDIMAKGASAVGDLYDIHLEGAEREAYYRSIAECIWTVYQRYPVPTSAFARTQADATAFAAAFNEISGLGANGLAVLTSKTPTAARRETVMRIMKGACTGYVTCAVGEEALDIPPLEVVHLIRRTRSITRNSQAAGRAFRLHPGKRRALLVDYQMMLDGVVKKFIGLPITQFRDVSGSRTPRVVNGGPIVCQKTYPEAALVGLTLDEERALVLRRENPAIAQYEEEQQRRETERARERAERPQKLAVWRTMYATWKDVLDRHIAADGPIRYLSYLHVSATAPNLDTRTSTYWLRKPDAHDAAAAMLLPRHSIWHVKYGKLETHQHVLYGFGDLSQALHLNSFVSTSGQASTLDALWAGRFNAETVAAIIILAFVEQLREARRERQTFEADEAVLNLLTDAKRRHEIGAAHLDPLLLPDALAVQHELHRYESQLVRSARHFIEAYFAEADTSYEVNVKRPDGERVTEPGWHHASAELLPLDLGEYLERTWRPRTLEDVAAMAAMHWLTICDQFDIVHVDCEAGEAGPRPEYRNENYRTVPSEEIAQSPYLATAPLLKISYDFSRAAFRKEILRRAQTSETPPPPFVDAPGLSERYQHEILDEKFAQEVRKVAPYWFPTPPEPPGKKKASRAIKAAQANTDKSNTVSEILVTDFRERQKLHVIQGGKSDKSTT